VDYQQRDWLKWLVTAEFVVNNKIYLVTKMSLLMTNYSIELKMETDIRRKGKVENILEFAERIKIQ